MVTLLVESGQPRQSLALRLAVFGGLWDVQGQLQAEQPVLRKQSRLMAEKQWKDQGAFQQMQSAGDFLLDGEVARWVCCLCRHRA
jgi:hypothetical protein